MSRLISFYICIYFFLKTFLTFLSSFFSHLSLLVTLSSLDLVLLLLFFPFTLINCFSLDSLFRTNYFSQSCNNFSITPKSFLYLWFCSLSILDHQVFKSFYGSKVCCFFFVFFFPSFPAKLISLSYFTSSSFPFRCCLLLIPLHHWRLESNSDVPSKNLNYETLLSKYLFLKYLSRQRKKL